jgi:hypothetical protein
MKKIFITLALLGVLAACEDITLIDKDPKRATIVQAQTLFANGQKELMDWVGDCNVNLNIFRLITQQWTETTYIDESNYDIHTRPIPDGQWNAIYRDVLRDLKEAHDLVGKNTDVGVVPDAQANQKAMIEIMQVLSWSIIVETWGNAPFTEALDAIKFPTPKYDDGKTIHAALITLLDGAIAALNPAAGGFDAGSDLLYNNNIGAWKKFGNSLKLRLGMLIADSDPATASTIVQQAIAGGVFTSNGDNAIFKYLDAPPNTNQVWVNLVQSGRNDFVIADTFVDHLNSTSDPRRPAYMTFDNSGTVYTGGIYGSNNNWATYSKVANPILVPSFEAVLLDYSEVKFFLAEAAARNMGGLTVAQAQAHYLAGITASMSYWNQFTTLNAGNVTAYLASAGVVNANNYKQLIGMESWVALYNRGFEAWTQYRRLDFPALVAPADALSGVPQRYTYPVNEQNLNKANYEKALSDEGMAQDKVENKLFWDKY